MKLEARRKTPKLSPLIALAFALAIILLYFPGSHKLLSNAGYQHLENTIITSTPLDPPPNPNNPPPHQKADTRRRSHSNTAEEYWPPKQSKSNDPPPNDSNTTTFEKPQVRESKSPTPARTGEMRPKDGCDLFTGEWVPNPEGPYYTSTTCYAIQEHQNCMKFGRPDTGYLKWRWKPDDCELPVFDPHKFLELMRGKSLAFVGDSVTRNHMQSLICLLSKEVYPVDVSDPTDQNKRYEYREYDFNISVFWSPYLVKTGKLDKEPFTLYLDQFDDHWTSKIALFDYVIISAGHWFFRPTYFYLNNSLIGCLYCPDSNITHLTAIFSYQRAFQTAFQAMNNAVNFKGVTFLRTFAPSHFEGGSWNNGGNCVRTRPFKRNETALKDDFLEMYSIQLEEFKTAQKEGIRNEGKFRLFDAMKPMLLRPDGHPSKYGHLPMANVTMPNDCVHWCLPGPIDSWNDILQELLQREIEDNR